MAYTAIDKMRKKNEQIYGRDVGPCRRAAILLHYDLYTYSIASGEDGTKPKFSMDMHPLAWLLMPAMPPRRMRMMLSGRSWRKIFPRCP